MDNKGFRSKSIYRYESQGRVGESDEVAIEEPLEIWLKQYTSAQQSRVELLSTTMRTPGCDIELVKGWLFTTGMIEMSLVQKFEHTGIDHMKGTEGNRIMITLKPGASIDVNKFQRHDYVHSSCGVCGQQSIEWLLEKLPPLNISNRLSLPGSSLNDLIIDLNQKQVLFRQTGGVHGVALFDESATIIDVKEDVGRHNAFDKLIGAHLHRFPAKLGVVLSGRVSFEMVQKAAMAGISMIVAIGAPTSLAVELCDERDIALIGFVKSTGFNLYTGQRQIAGY